MKFGNMGAFSHHQVCEKTSFDTHPGGIIGTTELTRCGGRLALPRGHLASESCSEWVKSWRQS